MGAPARFPFGVTNVAPTTNLAQYGRTDPASWHQYFTDFDYYVAGDWTITSVGAATQALTDIDGGALLLTNAAADDNSCFFNKKGESFLFATGKKLIFKARFKVSDATQSDLVIGLQITDTTILAVSDGVFFQKDDGDAFLDFLVEKNGTASTAVAATLVTDTFVVVGFYYDGKSEIQYFVNDALVGIHPTTNLVDDEELTVSFGVQNGEAVAKTMTIDYIFAAKER
jgi:hypothetical protein